ncbi:MAG: hypothetical protein JST00_16720 [Deltaproteobacteria bacterium]|nr:hypothetical protein [Deltaproteobacteria bacterium]
MRTFALVVVSTILAAGLAACGAGTTPRSRVAADLGCSAPATRVEKIADLATDRPSARWQVSGCGRTAVYVCTTPVRDCWREGSVRPETEVDSPR